MEYPKGYVYQLMDNGGPTDVREPYFVDWHERNHLSRRNDWQICSCGSRRGCYQRCARLRRCGRLPCQSHQNAKPRGTEGIIF